MTRPTTGVAGASVVNLETYRIAVMALGSHRLLHGTHDVAALAQVAQGSTPGDHQVPRRPVTVRLRGPSSPACQDGAAGASDPPWPRMFSGAWRRSSRPSSAASFTIGPVDAGEAVLVDLGGQLAALLDLGDGAEFQRRQFARPFADAVGEIVAVDDQILAHIGRVR